MTELEIIEALERGDNVTLDNGKIYDFTNFNSIRVGSILDGNGATIIANNLYRNQPLMFLFNIQGGTIQNLNIIGPNPNIGPPNTTDYWGAINILSTGTVFNCNFSNCDKWAIKCTSHPSKLDKMSILDCTFNNIRRAGFGYGIWNQYGDVLIENCKFTDCRHGVDGSSKVFKTVIRNCEFDKGNYIHINMHAYSDDIRGGHSVIIDNCSFYDSAQALELKLPYSTSTGLISVTDCNFYTDFGKIGKVAEFHNVESYTDPQYVFSNNTVNALGLLYIGAITGPSVVNINEHHSYGTTKCDSYVWSTGETLEKISRMIQTPEIGVIDVYGIIDNERTLRSYKTVEVKEPGKSYLSFFIKGWGSIVEVMRDNIVIDTIDSNSCTNWKKFLYYGTGKYKLRVSGAGHLYLDDWCQESFSTTLEDKLDLKLKYFPDATKSVSADMFKGDARSGKGCLRLRLPSTNSKIEINANIK